MLEDLIQLGRPLEAQMHPQYLCFLIEYYIHGGSRNFEDLMPTFHEKFTRIAELSLQFDVQEMDSISKIINGLKNEGSQPGVGSKDEILGYWDFFFNKKLLKTKELISILFIATLVGHNEHIWTFFELLKGTKCDGAHRLARRCQKSGSKLDSLGMCYLLEKIGPRSNEKFLQTLTQYREVLEEIVEDLERKARDENAFKISPDEYRSPNEGYSLEHLLYRIFKLGEQIGFENRHAMCVNQIV